MDLKGTIVPAYAINSALGRIPLMGTSSSPERGGGLVSVAYTVRGPRAEPLGHRQSALSLTPGFLRGIFKMLPDLSPLSRQLAGEGL